MNAKIGKNPRVAGQISNANRLIAAVENSAKPTLIPKLLDLFVSTDDFKVKDTIAIAFRNFPRREILPVLFSEIGRDANRDHTSSLVYALSFFDLSKHLSDLLEIVINGSSESAELVVMIVTENRSEWSVKERKNILKRLGKLLDSGFKFSNGKYLKRAFKVLQ